jgi:ATP-dependent Zn protease
MTNGTTANDLEPEHLPVLPPESAPSLGEPALRPRSNPWDRSKVGLLIAAVWWVLLWADLTNNPIESLGDAASNQLRGFWWIEALFGLEILRQINYFLSERSSGWNRSVGLGLGRAFRRATSPISDWTKFRIGRVIRVLVLLLIISGILGAIYHTSPITAIFQVPASLYSAAPFIFELIFGLLFGMIQIIGIFWAMSRGGVDVYFPGDVKTRFSDIWGQDSVLERVKENIIYLKDPESIENRGGYVPGGILLWGPPGTGKTLIAEAVAGETSNPFVFVDPGAFNGVFFGVGILKVKLLFRKLRRLSLRYGGVVVFFDEADSLGNRGVLSPGGVFPGRFSPHNHSPFAPSTCNGLSYLNASTASQLFAASLPSGSDPEPPRRRIAGMMGMGMGGGGQGTLQSLLAEMSGLTKPRGLFNRVLRRLLGMKPAKPPKYRILVMMATNMPDSLDEAMLRPGRIDRIYKVGYPSKAGRIRTYKGYFDKVAHSLTDADIDRLATITPYATGATIKDLVNESLITAIREGHEVITWSDVVRAKQMKDLGPPEDVEYIERERHAVAVHEACHAVAAARVQRQSVIDIATIEKGGSYLGMVSWVRAEDTFTQWRSDYEADVMVSLASLAGEKMFFEGDNSSGVAGDLNSATILATYMEGYWGMGQTLSSHGITQQAGIQGGTVRGRRREEGGMPENRHLGERIERKLLELLERTVKLIEENRLEVLAVAHALETNKTVTGEDILAIIEGRKGPILDGRKYHSPEFRQLVEEYHTEAVRAHRSHGSVDLELPKLPSLDDIPVLEEAGAVAGSSGSIGSNGTEAPPAH